MSTYQTARGMRDLLPAEAAGFDALAAVFFARARRYGYPRLVTPAVEDREVFLRTAGTTSDTAGKEMYDVLLHGEPGLALRPEGTAPVARAYLQHGLHRVPQPVRLSYWEPMFRGQRPQIADVCVRHHHNELRPTGTRGLRSRSPASKHSRSMADPTRSCRSSAPFL